ncbi:hypothetical protein MKX01_000239 [Papaver californicum]|nr:hypothetical protein MKX01_000239 [Papaver californicum]
MGRLTFGKVLDCFCMSPPKGSNFCFCINSLEALEDDDFERKPLIGKERSHQLMKLGDPVNGTQTLAFQKPKMVVLRVSMHCNGCAKKVEKHISKMDGVISYQVVIGHVLPYEVLESYLK